MSKIITWESSLPTKEYTWDSSWISDYESAWCILEKFKFFNSFSDTDMFRLFGTEVTKRKKNNSWSKINRELYSLNAFDDVIIKEIIGPHIKENTQNHLKTWMDGFIKHQSHFLKNELNFCPICISQHYHSIFHQFTLINKCPFHQVKLENQCPNCAVKIPYELNEKHFLKPFQCKCGYMLMAEPYKFFKGGGNDRIEIVSDDLQTWLNLTTIERDKLKNIEFSTSIFDRCYDFNLLDKFNTVIKDDQKQTLEKFVKIRNEMKIGNPRIMETDKLARVYRVILASSISVYKAIARHIRKKLLKDHKHCIKYLVRKQPKQPLCPFAIAYVQWRQFIEAAEDYTHIENDNRTNAWRDDPNFASFLDNDYLGKISTDLLHSSGRLSEKTTVMTTIINRVMAHLILNHFCRWLDFSKEQAKKRYMHNRLPENFANHPIVLFSFLNKKRTVVDFYVWNNLFSNLSLDHHDCPYFGVKNKPKAVPYKPHEYYDFYRKAADLVDT